MKKIFILVAIVAVIGFAFMQCTPEQREHLNPLDPEYTGTGSSGSSSGGSDDDGGTTPTYHTGVISFNSSSYTGTNTSATITLTDADLTASTVNVNVKSSSDTTGITVTLNKGTSSYTGTVDFTTGASGFGKIQVANGDTVTVSYSDANPSGIRTDTATWVTNGSSSTTLSNFIVYDDNVKYPASGFMGPSNGASLTIELQSSDSPYNGSHCWKIISDGTESWAGIYIQYKGDWRTNTSPPYANLTNYNTLVFYARSTNNITINELGMGDTSGSGDSSGQCKLSHQNLTTTWQRFEIDLSSKDMSSINGLFYFSEGTGPYTIYFDNIFYTNK